MLSAPALRVVDRLITTLVTLVHAVLPRGAAPALPIAAAENLLARLGNLLHDLIRISAFGVRASPKPAARATRAAPPSAPIPRGASFGLPRCPGWLLEALPDIAPPVAADIAALLADPATAPLLASAPAIDRALRPILRALGLPVPKRTPAPQPPPSGANPPNPTPPNPTPPNPGPNPPSPTRPIPAEASKTALSSTGFLHGQFVTLS